jgi:ribosome-binding protein aMBF1 (putative translation factor)
MAQKIRTRIDAYQRVQSSNAQRNLEHGNELFHKLRQVRIDRGISQQALAATIGCSVNDINRYEHRIHLPNSDTFLAWLEVLGFTVVPPKA